MQGGGGKKVDHFKFKLAIDYFIILTTLMASNK